MSIFQKLLIHVISRFGNDSLQGFVIFRCLNHFTLKKTFPILFFLISVFTAFADEGFKRTQEIEMREGWNSVFLEIDPEKNDPESFIKGTPIDIVATLYRRKSTAQFSSDPNVNLLREQGWSVWRAKDRPDAFLSDFSVISGARAYLIHSKADFSWSIKGELGVFSKITWQTNAFNFVGFSVEKNAGPSFEQFFKHSKSHKDSPIYRLKNGRWVFVEQKGAELMRSGEAFWIYCDGASDYNGPFELKMRSSVVGLVVGGSGGSVDLRNLTDHPLDVSMRQHVPAGKTQPIDIAVRVIDDPYDSIKTEALKLESGGWAHDLKTLEAGQAIKVPFLRRVDEMLNNQHKSLLEFKTDLGTNHWIRVTTVRE